MLKVQARKALLMRWVVMTAVLLALLVIPLCAGMMARWFWNEGADGLVEPLLQVPMATFWSSLLPADSMGQKPLPLEFYAMLFAVLVIAFCGWRVWHHWRLLGRANAARSMRNL